MLFRSPKGFRWHEQAFPDETHTSLPLRAQIDALRSLYSGYKLREGMVDQGLSAVQKHYEEVSEMLGQTIAVPENVINDLGYAALSQGRFPDAIALFKSNVDANPNSANAYDSLADGYAKAEQWQEAARASDKALALATQLGLPNSSYFAQQAKKMNDRLKHGSESPR